MKKLMLLVLVTTAMPSGQTVQQVPALLLLESSRPTIEFAMLLADASVPSGIEIRQTDGAYFRQLQFGLDRRDTVPVTKVIDAFNVTHADYQAALRDGVFVIRPIGRRAQFIDTPSIVQRLDVAGMMNALNKVFAQLVPSLGIPPAGIIRNFLGGVPPDLGDEVVVHVDGFDGEKRVIDVLNDIVKQAPRTWYVETSTTDHTKEPQIVRVGFLLRNGKGILEQIP